MVVHFLICNTKGGNFELPAYTLHPKYALLGKWEKRRQCVTMPHKLPKVTILHAHQFLHETFLFLPCNLSSV